MHEKCPSCPTKAIVSVKLRYNTMTAASIVLALVVAILVDSNGITFSNGFHVNSAPTFARGRFVDAGRTRLCGAASDRDAVGDDPTTIVGILHLDTLGIPFKSTLRQRLYRRGNRRDERGHAAEAA